MYEGDPFLTLTPWGRVGLIAVSAMLAGLFLFAIHRSTRGHSLPLRLGIAALAFFTFVWLSPQVYYLYFLTLFDGLPWQNVVQAPPSPRDLFTFLTFGHRATLANHAVGVLGWASFGAASRRR